MYYNMYVHNLRHKPIMRTITATNARANLFQILKETSKNHTASRISHKDGAVIVISEEDYESLLETAELSAIPGLVDSIKESDKQIAGKQTYTLEQVFKD